MDFALGLKVLEKFDESISGVLFRVAVSVENSCFCEEVSEIERAVHVVEFDFLNAAHGVIFQRDVHPRVVLPRHVEEFGIVRQDLFPFAGDLHERAFSLENDKVSVLPVDCRLSGDVGGQQCRANCRRFLRTVTEVFVRLRVVEVDYGVHELFDAEENGVALSRVKVAFTAFSDFSGQTAKYDGRRHATIADREVGNAHAQDCAIEFGERVGVVVVGNVGNFVDRIDFAVTLVAAHLDDSAL